ncbi:hypothetical protein Daus18300_005321 [Diaporthe australafricana]|uniref:Major facilitator superfamily (MFS) profile domain-containing protein n=1 Tax=Diaporthe australafricana TaxID=127596 RepID=A0ABR3X2C6_9PEZI
MVFWQGSPEDSRNGFGGNNGHLPTTVNQALKSSTSAGIIIGQILFGWLADYLGRRKMYGVELGIILVATMNFALASPSQSMNSTALLTFHRVIMGVGIGGDYPLSSVITSEFAPTRFRGGMMAAVFSMQGFGQLLAAIVALVVTVAFKESFIGIADVSECDLNCQIAADRCWRIIVGVGALPAVFALYYRITIPETPRYTFDVVHDVEKADTDINSFLSKSKAEIDIVRQARLLKVAGPSLTTPAASWRDLGSYFGRWKNAKVLLGTTLSWFFLDLAFYGLGLNNSIVLSATGYVNGETLYHKLYNNAVGLIILSVAGSLPGYWTAVFTIDTIGRKPLQIGGFLVLIILFCILGFAYHSLNAGSMFALYIIAQFFFNLGPNTTTFIVPGECFPTRYRASGHGLSAAAGKIGAIVAQIISLPLMTKDGGARIDTLLQIFALFMLCGLFTSFLVPETKGLTLEELAGEPPTSYNSGRNGSVSFDAMPKRRWNPFGGGKPAGFMYPRSSRGSMKRTWRRSPTVGAMSVSEMAAASDPETCKPAPVKREWWRKSRRHGSSSGNHDSDFGMSSSTSSTRMIGGGHPISPPPGSVPSWNAGWGRIDRGAAPDNIRLQDVGGLME